MEKLKAKANLLIGIGLATVLLGGLFFLLGYERTWQLWSIPVMMPHFADTRVITAGIESYAQGFDPLARNPNDPWGRYMNYPRVWCLLYLFGVTQADTTVIGLVMIGLFLTSLCLLWPRVSNLAVLLIVGALLSPAVLLGIERANTDLLMFTLLTGAILTAPRWRVVANGLVWVAFVLKLYPIVGLLVLLKKRPESLKRFVLVNLVFIAGYVLLTLRDLMLVSRATPRASFLSYGMNILWMDTMEQQPMYGASARIISYVGVVLIMLLSLTALFRDNIASETEADLPYLDAFRMGAVIYTGTFLIGNNWDYRLMFLILALPQLLDWIRSGQRIQRGIALATCVCVFISFWYLLLCRYSLMVPNGLGLSFLLDEIANWGVFAGMCYLLCLSVPRWLRGEALGVAARLRLYRPPVAEPVA